MTQTILVVEQKLYLVKKPFLISLENETKRDHEYFKKLIKVFAEKNFFHRMGLESENNEYKFCGSIIGSDDSIGERYSDLLSAPVITFIKISENGYMMLPALNVGAAEIGRNLCDPYCIVVYSDTKSLVNKMAIIPIEEAFSKIDLLTSYNIGKSVKSQNHINIYASSLDDSIYQEIKHELEKREECIIIYMDEPLSTIMKIQESGIRGIIKESGISLEEYLYCDNGKFFKIDTKGCYGYSYQFNELHKEMVDLNTCFIPD